MGSAADPLHPPAATTARANGRAALILLLALMGRGLRHLVLCPGSRSAPLAVAAALLEPRGLRLHTAIDERSAAFFALGLGRGSGLPTAVVTTSGTAVAHLLAAAVEADLGTIPLLLLSADRPAPLKNCGANQAVPQEGFLGACRRLLLEGPPGGLASCGPGDLVRLAAGAMAAALGDGRLQPAGPVHVNLPFAEPLHADGADLEALARELEGLATELEALAIAPPEWAAPPGDFAGPAGAAGRQGSDRSPAASAPAPLEPPRLDPDRPGVVVAGPWRGSPGQWDDHCTALRRWQERSGWPVLADALSGLRGLAGLEVMAAYDLLLEQPAAELAAPQVLRLGTLPASRRLQQWLQVCGGRQVLVSQGDPRRLDPLALVAPADQWSGGLASWLAGQGLPEPGASPADPAPSAVALSHGRSWRRAEAAAQAALDRALSASGAAPPGPELAEPWLARRLSRLLPAGVPLMLASSSPVRDWESFSDPRAPWRPIHGFRGASGIDGTLSIACGLAEALGQLVLVSGDLALLHDSNGWLWSRRLGGRLTVVLIENGGGGIFEQLPIRTDPPDRLDFERLFAMAQPIDQLALAALHGVPGRRLGGAAELAPALAWALEQPIALLEVRSQRRQDAALRGRLRREVAASPGRMADRDPQLP